MMNARFRRPLLRWTLRLLLVSSLSLLATSCLAGRDMPADGLSRVRVSGEASVGAAPDRTVVVLGVVTEAASAEEAVGQNARGVKSVSAALDKVVGKTGRTESQGYHLAPRYRHQKNGQRLLEGYTVTSRIRVESSDVERAGAIIDAATKAGAGEVQQVRFELSDDQAQRSEALTLATRQARAKADVMASALGLKVIRVLSVREGSGHGVPGPLRSEMRVSHMAASPPTRIEPTGVEVRATVMPEVEVA
jgi:uncharacterized protein YggE